MLRLLIKAFIFLFIISICWLYFLSYNEKDPLHLWESWTIYHNASRIKISKVNLEQKLLLNQLSLQVSPAPWNIQQRVDLLKLQQEDGIDNKEEIIYMKERGKTLFNAEVK